MPSFPNKNSLIPQLNSYMRPCANCIGTPSSPYTPTVQQTAQMPTGFPTEPMYSSPVPVQQTPSTPMTQVPVDSDSLIPETVLNTAFTQGYLRTQIGKHVKVEFLIGTNMFVDREGTLVDVGASYIIIRETRTDDLLLCDMYSIKFVRFYY
jgi:hypothetical protein